MDLTGRLLRVAASYPHVLVVAVPGQTPARLSAEAEIGRRGWPPADSPADADLLVVAGRPGPRLAPVIDAVWGQMPAPRAQLTVTTTTDVADALDAGVRELADVDAQRRAPAPGPGAPPATPGPAAPGSTGADDAVHADAGHDTSGGHHRHGGGMEMPGGIPMADLGEDRDGLMLDALHVSVGPVLPDWPAGLVLRLVLQGDVVVEAEAETYDPPESSVSYWTEPAQRSAAGEAVTVGDVARRAAAGHLDGLSRFLGVAGWADPATRARLLRDAMLAGDPAGTVTADAADLVRRVGRSRTLRWLIRGISAGDDDVAGRLGARLAALGVALESLEDARPAAPTDLERLAVARIGPGELHALLIGTEFAAARLAVAVLDPDTDLVVPTGEAEHHGRA